MTERTLPLVDDCWNRIGVYGDQSCPELVRVTHCRSCPVFAAAGARLFDREPPSGYLEERTRVFGESPPTTTKAEHSVVAFVLGTETFGLDTMSVVEVAERRPVHRLPRRSNRVLAGIVNLHGQLELCVSLAGLLRLDAAGTAPGHHVRPGMLLIERGGRRWVCSADDVLGIRRFSEASVLDAPSTSARGGESFVRGIVRQEDSALGWLDAERVFTALEQSTS